MQDAFAQVGSGPLRGVRMGEVVRFLDIPYAAAPVGPLRFCEPQPHAPWIEVRDATRKGPSAPYALAAFEAQDLEPLVGKGWDKGDDYLNLNVWAPVDAKNAPIMVFIHGGAFTGGAAMAPVQDGSTFARDGVILISITYRLGIDGFLPIEGAPTNLGLRDMIAALQWVQANAAAFGGDAGNVTVFGESAGAMAVADLLVSPLAKGLFRRVIIQSGHGSMVRTRAVTEKVTRKVAKLLGIAPTVEGFRSVSIERGLEALMKVSQPTTRLDLRGENGREPAYGLSRFLPIHGDDVIPIPPLEAIRAGAGAEVDMLIGTDSEEMNIYLVPTGVKARIGKLLSWFVLSRSERNAGKILKAYGMGRKGVKPGEALAAALTDLVFRWPARVFAAGHKGRTHVYEFGWRSSAFDGALGACHAVEMPFVFDTLSTGTGPKGLLGENPPQGLADHVHKIWVDYARDGAAPWPEYDAAKRQVYRLDQQTTITEPEMPVERFWS